MTPAGFIIEAGDSGRIIISRGSRGEEKVEEVEVRRRVEGEGAGEDWDALFFAGERERGDGNAGSGWDAASPSRDFRASTCPLQPPARCPCPVYLDNCTCLYARPSHSQGGPPGWPSRCLRVSVCMWL